MERFMQYMIDGFRQSIVVGVPNFDENNQYQDGKNIAKDFCIAKKRVVRDYEKSKTKKTSK